MDFNNEPYQLPEFMNFKQKEQLEADQMIIQVHVMDTNELMQVEEELK